MPVRRLPLTEEQFNHLPISPEWAIDELPKEYWVKIRGLPRLDETVAIMASGSITNPQIMHGINVVAGIDVLAYELNPQPGEPEGNAYHLIFQHIDHPTHPYIMHGRYKCGTMVSHWYEYEELSRYWVE